MTATGRSPHVCRVAIAAFFVLALAGCQFTIPPLITVRGAAAPSPMPEYATTPVEAHGKQPRSNFAPKLTEASPEEPEAEQLSAAIAELETIGELDPDMKRQIIEDLRKLKPEMWQPMLQVYRTALTYRAQKLASADTARPVDADLTAPAPPPGVAASKPQTVTTADVQPAISLPAPTATATLPVASLAASPPVTTAAHSIDTTPEAVQHAAAPTAIAVSAQTPVETPAAEDWQSLLKRTIEEMEKETSQSPRNAEEIARHAQLRMMYLVAQRREDALKPIEGLPPGQQDFWSKQIFGLDTMLDVERNPDATRRMGEASRQLSDASATLAELSPLAVRNVSFCTEVKSFGVYKRFDAFEFEPGEEVLLYAEIENFKCDVNEEGFHTALRNSYQILDSRGQRVAEHDFATTEEVCRNRRRDFFMHYRIFMPKIIFPGTYTLKLTIEDVKSQKIGQASIDFRVTEAR